ncbi:MAG: hypothetical protein APR62_12885 [Smithella sp. SDB]|nr:MAG: hypothetical protein APR62_12885 [Smithella sp. SDB]
MRYLLPRTQNLRVTFISLCFMSIVFSFLITGCSGYGKPQYNVENYLLSYAMPSRNNPDMLATSVKFNRFSIAAAYNTTNMVFRSDAYSFDSFNYSRWAVNPADMVADILLRDMRASRLFSVVFSRSEEDQGRFVISGGIEEFYLRIDKNNNKTAVVSIAISLKDTREKETGKMIMFQKKYVHEESLQESSPRGYCQAASEAMRTISERVTHDIYTAIKTNLQ